VFCWLGVKVSWKRASKRVKIPYLTSIDYVLSRFGYWGNHRKVVFLVILDLGEVWYCQRNRSCHCFVESGCLRMQPKVGGKFHLKLNTYERPIANKYREGKVKRTLKRELKVLEIVKREAVGFSLSRERGINSVIW